MSPHNVKLTNADQKTQIFNQFLMLPKRKLKNQHFQGGLTIYYSGCRSSLRFDEILLGEVKHVN